MKTIRCNFTKACRIFATFIEIIMYEYGDTSLKFQDISPVYRRIIRSPLSLLVYARSIEFVSILT